MADALTTLGRITRYSALLALDALGYCWRWSVDLVAGLRAAGLWYVRRRSPERSSEVSARFAKLRQSRAGRWAAWGAVPWRRRMQVRAAALVLMVLAVVSVRSYERRHNRFALARPTKGSRAPGAGQARFVYPTIAPKPTLTPENPTSVFRHEIEAARSGAWVTAREIRPVVAPGPLGSWDDFKVGSPVVLGEGGGGYGLWYRGCHFLGAEYWCGVGHATSKDGVTWERRADPVFAPSDAYEREHLDAIAIARGASGYVLWYSVSPTGAVDRRRASLHVARSPDGLTWTAQSGPVYEAVAQGTRLIPTALWREGRFHLWVIDSRSAIDPATSLFPEMPADGDDALLHFMSIDGARLEAAGSTPIQPLQMDPVAFSIGPDAAGGFRAFFYEQHPSGANRQGVAVLRSPDGNTWERAPGEAMPLGVSDLDYRGVPVSLAVVSAERGLLAWFVVRGDHGGESIRVAFHKDGT